MEIVSSKNKRMKDFKAFLSSVMEPLGNRVKPGNDFLEFKKEDIEQSVPHRFEEQVKKYPHKIAVISNNSNLTYNYLKEHLPEVSPVIFKDHETLIKATLNGDVQAFLMEGPVASTYIAKHNGFSKIKKLEDPLFSKPLFAGVKKGNIGFLFPRVLFC